MAVIFFAQIYGFDLTYSALTILIVTIIGSSIGAPATPGVGIVVLSVVLRGMGIPLEGLVLIIGIDQIMERFRAMLNITGDLVASIVINRISPTPGVPSYEEEIAQEHKLEQHRKSTGEDIIIQ
jgi:Na+/H+-dicarboxylate symporter